MNRIVRTRRSTGCRPIKSLPMGCKPSDSTTCPLSTIRRCNEYPCNEDAAKWALHGRTNAEARAIAAIRAFLTSANHDLKRGNLYNGDNPTDSGEPWVCVHVMITVPP